ncbi:MAG: molybdenum cofactor biosynthesis protein MoaE, partial [Deltaproteobacteria bacterium]|nr:molybdenum cofactor biosynthesis protein MoaE [Deltaproteobacteria bacterium]
MSTSSYTKIDICDGPIKSDWLKEIPQNPAHGAATQFEGIVRNRNHGRDVVAVSYDCHKALARRELMKILEEARAKWGKSLDAIILHGSGRLSVGNISVAIAVTTPHRNEAFEACRYIIEELKVRATVWKQEHYVDGDSEWLKGHELCQMGGHSEGSRSHSC